MAERRTPVDPMGQPTAREIMAAIDRIDARTQRVETILIGDKNPAESMVVRLDRAQQQLETQRWWTRSVGVAAITALGIALRQLFTGNSGH